MRTPDHGDRQSPSEELALLARLRSGDRDAFAALVARHGGAMLRLARSLVKDGTVAEEVVQEGWLSALEHLGGFEGRASLKTWLFRIVINGARTRLARDGRSVPFSALGELAEGDEPSVPEDRFAPDGHWKSPVAPWTVQDPERLAQAAETQALLQQAISELPEAMRAVLTLRDVEGLEADEICNLLSISVSNQRVLLHRARARVRLALERHLGGAR
jgi:RNA polymerase sigma-70 factor (ECF subfamily)